MARSTKKQQTTRIRTARVRAHESSTGTANFAGITFNSRASQHLWPIFSSQSRDMCCINLSSGI